MSVQKFTSSSRQLPVVDSLARAYALSSTVVVLTAVASIIGLLFQTAVYPAAELRQSYVINDALNLIIGLPILLISMWFASRGRVVGLLLWPGGLLYSLYNYTAYIFGMPISFRVVVYLVIVLLSAYTIFEILKNIDNHAVKAHLADAIPAKTTGWLLAVFGALFIFRAVWLLVDAVINQAMLPITELGTTIADIILSMLWMAGGVLLLRRMSLGYVSGLGLLFAICMLFVGLILLLILQPVITDAPFVLLDVIVVSVMGLIFFVPFGFYVRGVLHREEVHVS